MAKVRAKRGSYDRDVVLADWATAKYTEGTLAAKHKISRSTAHNIVAGKPKTLKPLIDKQCELNQEVALLSDIELTRFNDEVAERSKHIQFFNNATVKNLSVMLTKIKTEERCPETKKIIDPGTSINDHRIAQAAIKDGKETVLGKDPTTAVQVNTGINVQITPEDLGCL